VHLDIDHVSVRFGEGSASVEALRDIDLRIEMGEFIAVVGPSGCGKSTLLNAIAGLIEPTDGMIAIGDRPVTGPDSDRAVVFQQPALFPWLNVLDNVAFGLRMKGVGRADRETKAREALKLVQLDGIAAKQAYELSGGMQQRVAIARALASDPAVLLLDEPFAALDALTREQLQEELNAIWRTTGKTCLFITHSVEEAVFLGTRILVMSSRPGRIVHEDILDFARTVGQTRTARAVKASAPFIAKREEVLDRIIHAHGA
jgi:taurine transport system ATP-binding protein